MELLLETIVSELGNILLVSDERQLYALDYAEYEPRMLKLLKKRYSELRLKSLNTPTNFGNLLREYLDGDLKCLNTIPVNPGGTLFQQEVWLALRAIPEGTVVTYGELARKINRPTASRAVGLANSLNPLAIVLPCHRVIGADTSLTGYAGGLARKEWLLRHEGVLLKSTKALN